MNEAIFFYVFGGLSVLMTMLMIVQRSPVASALCLISSFFGLAALYVLLDATFVAVLQILVYAGAIMVLFIFVIMLLNLKPEILKENKIDASHLGYLVLGGAFAGVIGYIFYTIPDIAQKTLPENFGGPKEVGRLLFTKYLIPFELASILILVAVVGSVLLASRRNR